MSKAMSKNFGFVNIAAGSMVDVTSTAVGMEYKSTPKWARKVAAAA